MNFVSLLNYNCLYILFQFEMVIYRGQKLTIIVTFGNLITIFLIELEEVIGQRILFFTTTKFYNL